MSLPHYPVSALALCPSRVKMVNRQQFHDYTLGDPNRCAALLGTLTRHVEGFLERLAPVSMENARYRLGYYLMSHTEAELTDAQKWELPVSKSVPAGQLGIQPETLSRVPGEFIEAGAARVAGRCIQEVNRDRLRAITRGTPLRSKGT